MKKKILLWMITGVVTLAAGTAVMAEEYTTSDGSVTLTTPDDQWKEISDPNTWVTLGNGQDTITILHYANGEPLPNMVTADSAYPLKYQAVLSDMREVIMITGSVKNPADYDAVVGAVQSAKINKTEELPVVQTASDVYAVEEAEATEYVISVRGLNVRPTYSASEGINVLGTLPYGTAVHVTGIVKCNGEDFGWRRIDYNGSSAYVSRSLLDTSEPAPLEAESGADGGSNVWKEPSVFNGHNGNNDPLLQPTSADDILLKNSENAVVYIHSDGNGAYCDNSGTTYTAEGAGQWTDEYGGSWSAIN